MALEMIPILAIELPVGLAKLGAGLAVGAGTPGASKLTKGPVGVSRMMPAYLPFAFTISSAD